MYGLIFNVGHVHIGAVKVYAVTTTKKALPLRV